MEGKVLRSLPVVAAAASGGWQSCNDLFFARQYSQMRDELFKSNMVCSFILSLLLMAVQVLIPAPRYAAAPACTSSSGHVLNDWLWLRSQDLPHGGALPARRLRLLAAAAADVGRGVETLPARPAVALLLDPRDRVGPDPGHARRHRRQLRNGLSRHCETEALLPWSDLPSFWRPYIPSFFSSLQLWCSTLGLHNSSSDPWLAPPTSTWPAINICTHPEVSLPPESPSPTRLRLRVNRRS